MEADKKLIDDVKRLMMIRYPRFGSEIAAASISYRTDLKYKTAATDGKNIYFDPNYLASLSEEDRLFLVAHELMHIKFKHALRLVDTKSGEKRDPQLWNVATDAIINANLERDGFTIKEGYVNMPEALQYNAVEFYDILKKRQEEQKQQQQQNGQSQSGEGQDNSQEQQSQQGGQSQAGEKQSPQNQNRQNQDGQQSENSQNGTEQAFADDHSLWEEAFEEAQKEAQKQKSGKSDKQSKSQSKASEQIDGSKEFELADYVDELADFEENRLERREHAKANMDRMKNQALHGTDTGEKIELGEVGEESDILDWKLLLRREIDKSETIWSQRRSIAENNYAYRLEENDVEDEAETEVMIDVSGSVQLEMVKAFLRTLKPLLRESKLRVGCFNEKFWGMVEIKSNRDIDNFTIPKDARGHSAWTEDWDLAVRSFSKKREVNKIVFTDGNPCPGTMPKGDLKNENVIWLCYDNRNFHPCCGKVIMLKEKDLQSAIKTDRTL